MDNSTGPYRSLLPAAIHCMSVQSLMGFLPALTAQFLVCQQALPWAGGHCSAQPSLLEHVGSKTRTAGLIHGLFLGIRNV